MKKIFDVDLLPEAVDFLESLDEKARNKVYYNIRKSSLETMIDKHTGMQGEAIKQARLERRLTQQQLGDLRVSF